MRYVFWIFCIQIYSCAEPTPSEALADYLKDQLGISEERFPQAIVVVSEDGCVHCNRAFANLVRPRVTDPGLLFVVRIEGSAVNMHGFMEEHERMRFDDDRSFQALGILEGSGLVLLDGGRIDTVISVQLEGIEEKLRAIESALEMISTRTGPHAMDNEP